MSPSRPPRLRAANAARWRLAAVVCVVAVGTTAVGGSAGADGVDDARARADAASERVAALQTQVDAARQDYRTTLRGLSTAVTREISADEAADAASRAALLAEQDRVGAIRALEQSGGSLAMVEGLLESASPSAFAARVKLSGEVLDLLATGSEFANDAATQSSTFAELQKRGTRVSMFTVADVESAYQRLNMLLTEQEEILATLDTEARALAKAAQLQGQIEAERAAASAAASTSSSAATAGGIPKPYVDLYRAAAATCPGLPWPVLAAIGQVESGHGTNTGPSAAGAMGPMQFLPSTFGAYAIDGDGDGVGDIWNPADAIYSAANYLCSNGAGGGPKALYSAVYNYNHADWYVLMVMRVAAQLAVRFGEPVPQAEAS